MSLGEFQTAIMNVFPTKEEELLFIYNKFGSLLFKKEWDNLLLYDVSRAEYWKSFDGIVFIMSNLSIEEKSIIANFIFQKAIGALTQMYSC